MTDPPSVSFCRVLVSSSILPMRTHASTTEDSSTSSIGASTPSISRMVLEMSSSLERALRFLSRMEHVTWFGLSPAAPISSSTAQTSLPPRTPARAFFATIEFTSSLNVTRLGSRPAARISCMSTRAFDKFSTCKCALISVLYETTSAIPAAMVRSIQASARRRSRHSTQASSTALYTTLFSSAPHWARDSNTSWAPFRLPSDAQLRIMATCFAMSDGALSRKPCARTPRPHRIAALMRLLSERESRDSLSPPWHACS
mmetsp:Transcript_38932/g.101424  ORF Transcript_38932/g.101424 Transcript_38932/m.101424 type:complete len:258 (-) Transcript_38932:522-1295(-)